MTVTPVDVRNYLSEVQQFTYEDRWPICREEGGQLVNATVGGGGVSVYPVRLDIFEPCCTMKLKIGNATGHTLSLAGATIQLEDGAGKTYDLPRNGDPFPTYQKNYTALLQRGRADLAQNLQAAGQQTIPVPGPDAKILPGKAKDFILPFNATEAQPPLKLMVYDLATAADAAGNASVKDNFDFAIAKTRAELWRHTSDATGAIEWNETEPTPAECE